VSDRFGQSVVLSVLSVSLSVYVIYLINYLINFFIEQWPSLTSGAFYHCSHGRHCKSPVEQKLRITNCKWLSLCLACRF